MKKKHTVYISLLYSYLNGGMASKIIALCLYWLRINGLKHGIDVDNLLFMERWKSEQFFFTIHLTLVQCVIMAIYIALQKFDFFGQK